MIRQARGYTGFVSFPTWHLTVRIVNGAQRSGVSVTIMLNGAAWPTILCRLDQGALHLEDPEDGRFCRVDGDFGDTVGPFRGSPALRVGCELNEAYGVELSVCIPTALAAEKYRLLH